MDLCIIANSQRLKGLFNSGKTGVLPTKSKQVLQTDDFELITWLVIS